MTAQGVVRSPERESIVSTLIRLVQNGPQFTEDAPPAWQGIALNQVPATHMRVGIGSFLEERFSPEDRVAFNLAMYDAMPPGSDEGAMPFNLYYGHHDGLHAIVAVSQGPGPDIVAWKVSSWKEVKERTRELERAASRAGVEAFANAVVSVHQDGHVYNHQR